MIYGAQNWPLVAAGTEVMDQNDFVRDVREAFDRLRVRGDFITAWDSRAIPNPRYTGENFGDARALIHFQGVQRLRTGGHFLVSGGDQLEPCSHVFVLQLGSIAAAAAGAGPLGSNVMFSRDPALEDRLVQIIGIETERWHAGGIYLLGDILAVPLEGIGVRDAAGQQIMSRVVFFHLADPMAPRRFGFEIPRTSAHAGAVTVTKLPNDYFLCAVWQDGVNQNDTGSLEFYLSRAPGEFGSFDPAFGTWKYPAGESGDRRNPAYQSIGFVQELPSGGVDSEWLYLIGTTNTEAKAPSVPGHDVADLFVVGLPRELLQNPISTAAGPLPAPTLTWLARKRLEGADEHCNFAAAAGVYVDPNGILCLYGGFHWRISGTIRLTEFRSEEPSLAGAAHEWLDLFDDTDFAGRRLSILGTGTTTLPNYDKVLAQGKGFGDKTSSLRYQLPVGTTYRLYRDRDFSPSDPKKCLDLDGTGGVVEVPDIEKLKRGFGDSVSSSKFV
jgi:hypothetical protein